MQNIVIVDVGSTTTKALLFGVRDGCWRYQERGESATTVEAPEADVMIGVLRSIRLLEDRSGLTLISGEYPDYSVNCSYFLATSSAGGGLQMVVCGNAKKITGESARRAALGGGAVLLEVFTPDDGYHHFHRLERLRSLRPDMILLSGGVEGAQNISFLIEMCDFIRTARPKSKFDSDTKLPIIFAGASGAIPTVIDLLETDFHLRIVDNLRPSFERENLGPTREAIHNLFVEHVMSNAPGYDSLSAIVSRPILPTPSSVGEILERYAKRINSDILCLDIGGATTDVYSVANGRFVRSVSANYGMSYSIGNVVADAGIDRIRCWLSDDITSAQIMESIGAKQLHPVTLPTTKNDLLIEQAVAREALRMSFEDHLELATIQSSRSSFESDLFVTHDKLRIEQFDIVIGSGGVLSNAPERKQAAVMLLDAVKPVGMTRLFVDSVFMLPHLGAYSIVDEEAALSVLELDCLIPLGTVLSPVGRVAHGQVGLQVSGFSSQGNTVIAEAKGGELIFVPLPSDEYADIELRCRNGVRWHGGSNIRVYGGECGLMLDLRQNSA